MSLLVAAILILSVLTVLNMALSAAIIRMLRGEREALVVPGAGDPVRAFSVDLLDGGTLDEQGLRDGALVAFVSPTCPPCTALVEKWVARAGDLPEETFAFVINTSTAEAARAYADALGVRAAVVATDSPVASAFGVGDVTPTLIRVRAGAIEAVGHTLESVLAERERVAG